MAGKQPFSRICRLDVHTVPGTSSALQREASHPAQAASQRLQTDRRERVVKTQMLAKFLGQFYRDARELHLLRAATLTTISELTEAQLLLHLSTPKRRN